MDRVRTGAEAASTGGGNAQTFAALKADINAKYGGLSRQLKTIGRFVLDHPNNVALETTATLARRAGVQPSALVRFAQALGYDGFSAMQQVFRSRLVPQFDSMRDRIETLGTVHANGGANGKTSIADDAVNAAQVSLERLRTGIDERALRRAGNVLARAEHIYVLGQGKSFPVAFYLHFALLRLQRPCTVLSGTGGSIAQEAALIGKEDALLTVSFRPYTPQVIDIARERHRLGVPVIAITDSSLSPLWATATAAFEVVDQDRQIYQSMVAPLCMAQILAISLGHRLMQNETARR